MMPWISNRWIEILAAYGVVPRALRIIQMYWGRLTMVDKAGGYPPPLTLPPT